VNGKTKGRRDEETKRQENKTSKTSDGHMSYENKIKILVVEDSSTQAEKIRYLLEKQNYDVTVAGDGKQAHEILSSPGNHKPSLVITDILMPVMNGYELCKIIKSVGHTKHIPVMLWRDSFVVQIVSSPNPTKMNSSYRKLKRLLVIIFLLRLKMMNQELKLILKEPGE
jgi:PleD family two-component response regulator